MFSVVWVVQIEFLGGLAPGLQRQFLMGAREIKFQFSQELCKHRKDRQSFTRKIFIL